jgi:hypothetical protein
MARASYTLRVAAAEPQRVLATLADFTQLTYHPLVVGAQPITPPRDETSDGQWYRVTDRIRFGPFTYRFTYQALSQLQAPDRLHTEAIQSPGVRLRMDYIASEEVGAGGWVEETCVITAPRLLLGYAKRQARAAHLALLTGLAARPPVAVGPAPTVDEAGR